MLDRYARHPLRLTAALVMLLAFAGVRDGSDALASAVHIIEVDTSLDVTSAPLLAPTEGELVLEAEPTAVPDAAGPTATPPVESVGQPQAVERSIVHVQTSDSAGSGFLVSGGRVVTNAHVIGDAVSATVWFSNGARRESRLVAIDEALDLAVLQVPRAPVSAEPLQLVSDDAESTAGSAVWAWGYPFEADVVAAGFSRAPTVSAGIVSARRVREDVAYIQTDAAVNPGSSGGPLLNASGLVVGVNTLVLTPNGEDAEGLNFALDVAVHRDVIDALLATRVLD